MSSSTATVAEPVADASSYGTFEFVSGDARDTSVQQEDFTHRTTLLEAVAAADCCTVLRCLQEGASADECTPTGVTALMKAVHAGNADLVQILLSNGADPTRCDDTNGSTALMLAAATGRADCAALLLQSGHVSPIEQDAEGRSPLQYAARRAHPEVLRLLLAACASASSSSPSSAVSLSAAGAAALVANVDIADETGLTPLMAAAHAGALDSVEQLIHAGASLYARDCTGASPLHCAAWNGHAHVVQRLLAAGARADMRDDDGRLPMDVAGDASLRAMLEAALSEQYEHWSAKSYDSAADDRPWH